MLSGGEFWDSTVACSKARETCLVVDSSRSQSLPSSPFLVNVQSLLRIWGVAFPLPVNKSGTTASQADATRTSGQEAEQASPRFSARG